MNNPPRFYQDGSEYRGQLDEQGQKKGQASLTFADKSEYSGQFENGFFHGYGVLLFYDGSRYEGQFIDGKFHGFGIFTHKTGIQYEGEFQYGCISGEGLITFSDGTHGIPRREGIFENNQLSVRKRCDDAIQQAYMAAETARNQSQA